jgi:hypothetical protein
MSCQEFRMKLVFNACAAALIVSQLASGDVIYPRTSNTYMQYVQYSHTVYNCTPNCSSSISPAVTTANGSLSVGYSIPLGARLNTASLYYYAYPARSVDYYQGGSLSDHPLNIDRSTSFGSLTIGSKTVDAPDNGATLDLLSLGFRDAIYSSQRADLTVSHTTRITERYGWTGPSGGSWTQYRRSDTDFWRDAELRLDYTPNPGPTVGAGADLVARYGSILALSGFANHVFGYGVTSEWRSSNGWTMAGTSGNVNLTGPAWQPGYHTLMLTGRDQYGRSAVDSMTLRIEAVPEPATYAMVGAALIGLSVFRRRK